MFKSEEYGTITIKFEALPAGPDWSGYMRLFPAKKQDDHQSNDVAPSDIDDNQIDLSSIPF